MADVENRVVLITGCSSGIGGALALEFAATGRRVIASARRLRAIACLPPMNCDRIVDTSFGLTQVR